MLAINTDGTLFAYYRFIRGLYGAKTPTDQQTSLCPFFHTLLWGSLFCVAFSPFILFGWIGMKLTGSLFKLKGDRVDRLFGWLDNKTRLPGAMERAPDAFAESPILIGLTFAVGLVIALASTAAGLTCLAMGLWYGVWYFDDILAWCGHASTSLFWAFGWYMFWLSHVLGAGLYWAQYWIVWFFTNGPMWSFIGYWTAWIVGSVLVVGSACMIVVYTAMLALRSRLAKWAGRFLLGKFNGLKEAAEARRRRLAKMKEEDEIKAAGRKGVGEWTCPYCDYANQGRLRCMNCDKERPAIEQKPSVLAVLFCSTLEAIFGLFAGAWGQVTKFGGSSVRVLGGVGVIWEYLKAVKDGVCPMIEFTTHRTLQDQARLAAIDLTAEQQAEGGNTNSAGQPESQ